MLLQILIRWLMTAGLFADGGGSMRTGQGQRRDPADSRRTQTSSRTPVRLAAGA